MQFVDRAEISVCAGAGGDGLVAFRKEKFIPRGGPAGGDGGKGGDVIFVADPQVNTLVDLRYKRNYSAEKGGNGGPNDRHGKNGESLTIRVPVGTMVYDKSTGRLIADLVEPGRDYTIAQGGSGGRGNARYATSTLQTPRFAELGMPTDPVDLTLELKLLADVGLVGFPNVGKSTLISRISAAKPKVADYPFTTLVPNLGVVRLEDHQSFVVADMPGLIEGAHEGLGLGHQFLRHIERTRMIVHMLDVSGLSEREPLEDYKTINNELDRFGEKLSKLPQIVVLNKIDVEGARELAKEVTAALQQPGLEIYEISAVTGEGVRELTFVLGRMLAQLPKSAPEVEKKVVRFTVDKSKEDAWEVENLGENQFRVRGKKIELLIKRTDMNNEYAVRRLHGQLEKIGVINRLRDLGAQEGDTVTIGSLVFDFTDEAY